MPAIAIKLFTVGEKGSAKKPMINKPRGMACAQWVGCLLAAGIGYPVVRLWPNRIPSILLSAKY
jgi:hypothetical protein